MTRGWAYGSVLFLALLLASAAVAKDAAAWLQEGNVVLRSGKIADALHAYDQVAMTEPESPYLQFNQALAHYAQDDFEKAVTLFDKAWLNARQLPRPDIALEARSQLGIGNCHFRECQRLSDADLKQAMEACTKSIQAYDQALVHEPELAAAENNRRVARYVFKRLLNEAAQRAKQAAEQQQQQQEITKELSELAEKQQQTAQQSDAAAKQSSPQQREQQREDIARKQEQISHDTEQLADKMRQLRGQNQPQQDDSAQQDPVQDSMDQARQKQADAEEKLEHQDFAGAAKDQQDAAEKLREVQDKLREEQEQQARQGEQQAGQKGQEGEEADEAQAGEEKQAGKEGEEGQEQQQGEQQNAQEQNGEGRDQQQDDKDGEQALRLSEDARDIIDNERRQRQRRSAGQGGAVKPVARDW